MRSIWRLAVLVATAQLPLAGVAAAKAPSGRYQAATETVRDTATGLTWQRQVAPGSYYGSDALRYCENLVLDGRDDWRLPTIKELVSLVDFGAIEPAIDAEAFPATPSKPFWASTTNPGGPFVAWVLDFRNGRQFFAAVELDDAHVRCVR